MSNQTLICRSMQSFFDLCDNKLVTLCNIHCTFLIIESDFLWMEIELRSKEVKHSPPVSLLIIINMYLKRIKANIYSVTLS